MQERHLAEARQHVAAGLIHIAKQHDIIATLADGGHDVTQAIELLETLLQTQRSHEAHRDRILKELGL